MITCKNCGIQKADGQVPAQNHDLHDSVCGIFSAKKRAVPTSVQYEVNRPQRDQYHSQYLMNLVFRKKYHSAHENYGKNGHCDVERHSDFLYEFHLHLLDFHKSVLPRAESDFFSCAQACEFRYGFRFAQSNFPNLSLCIPNRRRLDPAQQGRGRQEFLCRAYRVRRDLNRSRSLR